MYVAVHRVVRSQDPGKPEGVNGFLYAHPGVTWPELPQDVVRRVEAARGELVDEELGLEPVGGNRVIAYLDLMFPDDEPRSAETLIAACRDALTELPPVVVNVDRGVARFGVELGSVDDRFALFDELAATSRALVARWRRDPG